jgi:hypothetical protein
MLDLNRIIKKISSEVEYDEIKLAKLLFNANVRGDKSLNQNALVKYFNQYSNVEIEIQNLKSVVNKKTGGIINLPQFMINFNHSYFWNKYIDLLQFDCIQSLINNVCSFSNIANGGMDLCSHKIALRMARHLEFNSIHAYFTNPIKSILKQRFNFNNIIINDKNIVIDDVIYNANPALVRFNELLKDGCYNHLFFSGIKNFIPSGSFTKKIKTENANICYQLLSFDKFKNHYQSESLINNCCKFIRTYGKDYFVLNRQYNLNIVLLTVKEL